MIEHEQVSSSPSEGLGSRKQSIATTKQTAGKRWPSVLELLSGEWLLTIVRWPNGGDAIFIRSLLVACEIYSLSLMFQNLLDSDRSWELSAPELMEQLKNSGRLFGAIFAAVYAALYARFSSQWTYLANVYNQIKAAECRAGFNKKPLAEWKAGFMEDADELHLACKPLFASVIREWGKAADVRLAFEEANDGSERFETLMKRVNNALQKKRERFVS